MKHSCNLIGHLLNQKRVQARKEDNRHFKDKRLKRLLDWLKKSNLAGSVSVVGDEAELGWAYKRHDDLNALRGYLNTDEYRGHVDPSNNIYIHLNHLNANAVFHLYGHLWIDAFKKHRLTLWLEVVKIIRNPPGRSYYDSLANNPIYTLRPNDSERIEEAFARAIGDAGQHVFADERMAGDFKDSFKQLLCNFKKRTAGVGIWDLSPEQISSLSFIDILDGAAADIANGEEIKAHLSQATSIVK